MSIPNSIKGLWHCCKCSLSLLSLCLQAVGLICSHICKIVLGQSTPASESAPGASQLGSDPSRARAKGGPARWKQSFVIFGECLSWGHTRLLVGSALGCAEEQRAGQNLSLVACGTVLWHSLTSPARALDTRLCFKNLLNMHHHHPFGACLAEEKSPLCPLHNSRQGFTISRSSAIQIHLYNLASSPLVQEWQAVAPALQAVLQKGARLLCWSTDVVLGVAETKPKKQRMPQI